MAAPEGKTLLWESKPSHWVMLTTYLGLLLAAGVSFSLAWYVTSDTFPLSFPEGDVDIQAYLVMGLIAVGAIFLVWLLCAIINLQYTNYALTTKTLYTRTNFLKGEHDTLWVHLIRDVRAELPIYLRIIGLGHVVITSLDRSHPNMRLKGIRDARYVKSMLNDMAPAQGAKYGVRGLDTG